jgi:ArsR family transcriptional regulator, arsenate/arsenite/antimonite-responsive transcriptional repressor
MSMRDANDRAVKVAKALGDPTRFALLRAVAARREMSCAELVEAFPLAQATVSHHLKVLAAAGLVAVRKSGQFHHYRALPEALEAHSAELVRAFSLGSPRAARAGRRP